jgi:hypothetical protein
MYISWKINDDINSISLHEFENDFEVFYGFIMLKLGDYELGYVDKRYPGDEGDDDISYYINSLIECGIVILLGQDYRIRLLTSNLLQIVVHRYMEFDSNNMDRINHVNIRVVNTETEKILCSFDVPINELIDEVINNYSKFINYIKSKNAVLLNSWAVRETTKYYDIFTQSLDFAREIANRFQTKIECLGGDGK